MMIAGRRRMQISQFANSFTAHIFSSNCISHPKLKTYPKGFWVLISFYTDGKCFIVEYEFHRLCPIGILVTLVPCIINTLVTPVKKNYRFLLWLFTGVLLFYHNSFGLENNWLNSNPSFLTLSAKLVECRNSNFKMIGRPSNEAQRQIQLPIIAVLFMTWSNCLHMFVWHQKWEKEVIVKKKLWQPISLHLLS